MISSNRKHWGTIIFLHIAKTAGTTLHRIIERQFQQDEDYFLRAPNHLFDDFLGLTLEEKARLRMLRGYMIFGIHEHLPQPATYFTLLRDPVERTISYFHHIRRSPDHYAHETIVSHNMNLKEALGHNVDQHLVNGQTRVLAGGKWHDDCTAGALAVAKRNLEERFSVAGLVERFDETLVLLARAFGWRDLFYTQQNVGQDRPQKEDLSPQVLQAVRKANEIDQKLYEYAAQRLDKDIRSEGPLFGVRVKLFQWVNPRVVKHRGLRPTR